MSLQDLLMLNEKCEELEAEIYQLKEELKRERECVDFYSKKENYRLADHGDRIQISGDDWDKVENERNFSYHGGRYARETQAQRKVEL